MNHLLTVSSLSQVLKRSQPLVAVASRSKYYNNRHRDPKYRHLRAKKVWKIELPNFDKRGTEGPTPEETRSKYKEMGVARPAPWYEKELYQGSTVSILEPYDTSNLDETSSSITGKIKNLPSLPKAYFKTKRAVGQIREYEGSDFDLDEFAKQSVNIYVKAHQILSDIDSESYEEKIFNYVTEYCEPYMSNGLQRCTLNWTYLGEVEPPRAVQARVGAGGNKQDKYAQITARLHTKQIVAIYDRHGRLIHGSPTDVKEVLEYVVFEKRLVDEFGTWRIHAKTSSTHTNVSQTAKSLRVLENSL